MRGERFGKTGEFVQKHGSSPHARGTLLEAMVDLNEFRFIPACAGNASKRQTAYLRLAVHPRMRGERYA